MEEPKRRGTDHPEALTSEGVDRETSRAMEHVADGRAEERRRHLAYAPSVPEPAVPAPAAARILVVDDEPVVRRLLDATLTMAGYQVVAEASGQAALARLEGTPAAFDLVVTDTRMPGMSGWQLIAEIRRRWPAQRLLRISGFYTDVEGPPPGLDPGSVAFLPKPFLPEELVRHVAVLLGR